MSKMDGVNLSLMTRRAMLGVVTTLICLAAAEVAVRLVFDGRFGRRPFFSARDEVLGWTPAANLDDTFFGADFSMRIATDEFTHRRVVGRPNDPGASRVLLLGDSYTFGWGVSQGETFADFLQAELNRDPSGVRVENLGVFGYSTTQSAKRMSRYLETEPAARDQVAVVVFMHSHNDMVDNVRIALFEGGFLRPSDEPKRIATSRTRSHLVNLIRELRSYRSQDTTVNRPDVLTAYPMVPTNSTRVAVPIDDELAVPRQEITPEHTSQPAVLAAEELTPIHRRLILRGINQVNCSISDHRITVLHTVIFSTPNWYVDEMKALVEGSETCGNDVRFVPQLTFASGFPHTNQNSGGHFSVAANGRYGRYLADYVRAALAREGQVVDDTAAPP